MVSIAGSAKPAAGHNRIPTANDRNPKNARTRLRRELSDILYPGALTSRLKRYAAEPAPDGANLTSISERTANGCENSARKLTAETGRPIVRRFPRGTRPDRPWRKCRAIFLPASGS